MNGRKPTQREQQKLHAALIVDYAERTRFHPQHRNGSVAPTPDCPLCREQGMAVKSAGRELWENYGFHILFGTGVVLFVIWFAAASGHPL